MSDSTNKSEGVAEPTAAPATGHAGAGALSSAPSDSSDAATIAELREALMVHDLNWCNAIVLYCTPEQINTITGYVLERRPAVASAAIAAGRKG